MHPRIKRLYGEGVITLVAILTFLALNSICHAGTMKKIKDTTWGVISNKTSTYMLFHVGWQLYGVGDAHRDAYHFGTKYSPETHLHGWATQDDFHKTKNLATIGTLLAGGSMAIDMAYHRYTWKQMFLRLGGAVLGANASWHMTYYYDRYGDMFPTGDRYGNAITIPLISGGNDLVIGLNRETNQYFTVAELFLYQASIAYDPFWKSF